jgi:putative membrane-bound dehydrogenase-like protein
MSSPFYSLLFLLCLPLFAAEPISLFDGKTLDGWVVIDSDKQFWRVEDGVIMADSLGKKMPRNTFMFTDKEYDHFEFRCKFRLTGDPKTGLVNSGIQFRSEMLKNGHAKGYQADIGEPKWWGCIYDEHRRGLIARSDVSKLKGTLKPFGWNDYLIRAKGPVLTLFINGIQTVEYIEKDANIPAKGRFALQLHSGGICRIEYKDITLTPLTYEGPKVPPQPVKASSLQEGDVMFADFESGTYEDWTSTGTAFGKTPLLISQTPSYQGDLNAAGEYCVNSHASAPGDDVGPKDGATGTLSSKAFTITHDYIRFLIGGGPHPGKTCMNLVVDGKVALSATGASNNRMAEASFDVHSLKGKTATLQIVDEVSSGWGNIGIDDIVFTNIKPKARPKPKPKRTGKKTQSGRTAAQSPAEQLEGFSVPDGFVVELVASEEDGVINPIDLTFDDAGRLWTNTAKMYPLDPDPGASWGQTLKYMDNPKLQQANPNFRRVQDMYEGKTRGDDQILIIADVTSKTPGKPSIWADGLAIPQSFLPYKNGAFVAHGSDMMYLEDTDQDGKADKRTTVLSGFGYTDTHTMAHLLIRAPGGWVNYSHGALNKGSVLTVKTGERVRIDYAKVARFSLDGMKHQLVASGLNNIWGYVLRGNGQWFGSEANDLGHSVTPMESGTGYSGIGNAKLRGYQPMLPPPHGFRVGGTGLSGLAFADNGGFPAAWENVAFLANPITSTINAVRIVRNPDGSVTAEHLADFMDSEDDWFRPVNLEFGPDGCLYIADFYNKIISHNEVPRAHPDRDKSHGRIWRVRHVGSKAPKPLDFTKLPTPILWAKRAAWHQIVDRQAQALIPAVSAIVADGAVSESSRIVALWSLEGLGHFDRSLWDSLLASAPDDLRREAVRALGNLPIDSADLAAMLRPLATHPNVMLRSQLLRSIEAHGKSHPALIDIALGFCGPDVPGGALGGPYERKFERYLARRALEPQANALATYLRTPQAKRHSDEHIAWASQALAPNELESVFLKQWPKMRQQPLDADGLRQISDMLRSPQVVEAVRPVFEAENASYLLKLALDNAPDVYSPELAALFTPLCQRLFDADQALALRAADEFHVPGLDKQLSALGDNPQAARVLSRRDTHAPVPLSGQPPSEGAAKIEHFKGLLVRKAGDPALGKPIFDGLCLSCHSVGGKGAGFSPPLDGSAHRDFEALLTAIFTPDAAMEGNYSLYSVQRADGTRIEGYLEKQDKRGITLRFMGGGSSFLPSVDIVSGGFVPGRSVMPTGLIDNLPDEQVANLIAYIRSLK